MIVVSVNRPTQLLLFIYQSIQTCLPTVFFRIFYFVNLLCATDQRCRLSTRWYCKH